MKNANEVLLKPRGLHAQIVRTKRMSGQFGMVADAMCSSSAKTRSCSTTSKWTMAVKSQLRGG